MGFVHGLPIGFAFLVKAFQEGDLIGLAYAYEQATNHRRPPGFGKSI